MAPWHPFKRVVVPHSPLWHYIFTKTQRLCAMNLEPMQQYAMPERRFMLGLARQTLASAVSNQPLPEVASGELVSGLTQKRACFVTLTDSTGLRGCIGHILPREPLYRAVMESARSAALRDPRFPPVQPEEVGRLRIEISVLTEPQPLLFGLPEELLEQLQPGEHGVLLRIGHRSATFLPQVWEHVPDKIQFLERLCEKAGCDSSAWQRTGAAVSVYRAECFEEPEVPEAQN